LAQHPLFEQLIQLQKDFEMPKFVENSVQHINAWFGTSGTVTPLHYDSYDNLFCQVIGFKYVRLYDPSQTQYLYVSNKNQQSKQNGKKDDIDFTLLQGNISPVNVDNPDFEKYPNFEKTKFSETIIGPGEMLFIPKGYWHFVTSLTVSFSISFWFQSNFGKEKN